jgi:hypothetical protein
MERNITRARVEVKYLIPQGLVETVLARLPSLETRVYGVTTVYFDRLDRALSAGALKSPAHCTKIRLREYLDGSPNLWIEIKTRSGSWTRKARFRIGREALSPLLRGGDLRDVPALACGPCDREAAEAFRRLREVAGGRLVALGAVSTARHAYRVSDLPFRMTLDRNVTYHRVSERLLQPGATLSPATLGAPLRRETAAILEIKHGGAVPEWLPDVLAGLAPTDYSKFRTLVRALDESCKVAGHVDRL